MIAQRTDIAVWIIEDHSEFRQTLAYLLDHTSEMHCAQAFPDYEAVQNLIDKSDEWQTPDVILMDFELPGMNGIEGLSHLKTRLPEVPIVMLTIRDDDEIIYNAFRGGASGYLTKNAPLDKLVAAIREAHQGGTLMPAGVARKVLKVFTETQPQTDYGLTKREKEILRLMGQGLAQKQIAHKLFLSYHTIDSHLRNIYRKLHVHSGIEAVAKAFQERIL